MASGPVMDNDRLNRLDSHRMSASDVVWSAHSITAPDPDRALLFESGGVLLALSADSVREVIDMPSTQPVPGSASWFGGVAVYRSRPVPVIDAAAYLKPGSESDTTAESAIRLFNRAIVVQLASDTYLIAAEKILNLCSLPVEDDFPVLQQLPNYIEHRAIGKVCNYENRLLAVIDLPELLRCTKLLRECAFC